MPAPLSGSHEEWFFLATPLQVHKGLIAGLIKGNQWVFINPDHNGWLFLRGGSFGGGS